jgi:purine-binding chemotaxis protein CheW
VNASAPAPARDTAAGPAPARALDALAGKYMTFQLAGENYGVGILTVREIIGLLEITRVPRAPSFVRGVINLRGRVIPVIDLRLKFGMSACETTDQTVIIVVQCQVEGRPLTMGILVDRVLEVLNVAADQIEPPPDLGDGGGGEAEAFLLGVGKAGQRVVFLLDIAKVLSAREAIAVARAGGDVA